MSSINFTGLSNIKVGGADCTVYLGANKMWPNTPPIFKVNNTQYNNGEWILDSDIYKNATYNVVSELDFDIHCEWHAGSINPGEEIRLIVDGNRVAQSDDERVPIDYSLKAGTYKIYLYVDSYSRNTCILKDKTYMKVKQ